MADEVETKFDDVARRLRAELIEIAVDQISRPIAHEFDIRIDIDEPSPIEPPAGYRRPAAGAITTLVQASSRSVRPVVLELRVNVWPADGRAGVADFLVIREGREQRLDVDLSDADPVISDELHHRLSDFVAGVIASALAQLNAEMQRLIGQHGGWIGPDDDVG